MNLRTTFVNRLKYPILLLLALLLGPLNPGVATALTIETSNIDGQMSVAPTGIFVSGVKNATKRTSLMGRNECSKAWQNDSNLVISYNFDQEITVNDCTGGIACVDKIMFFSIPIDEMPENFECKKDSTNFCVQVDQTNLPDFTITNKTSNSFDLQVKFRRLVNEAVVELDANNQVKPIQSADDCVMEGQASINQQYVVRLFLKNLGNNADQFEYSDMVIEIDTKRPEGPVRINSLTVTEANIFANWIQEDKRKLRDFVFYWSDTDFSHLSPPEIEASDAIESQTVLLDNLEPEGTEYSGKVPLPSVPGGDNGRVFVAISSLDNAKNASPPTFPDEELDPDGTGFEVLGVIDFWENYREAGGSETGGCNVAPGDADEPPSPAALLTLLGFAGLWGWRRRTFRPQPGRKNGPARAKHRVLTGFLAAILVFGALAVAAPAAHAQSPIYGIAEIRLGGHYPSIDDEAGLTGSPFEDIFGDGRRVLFEYEMGVHLLQAFGSLGLSGTVGYTNFSGDVLIKDASDNPSTDTLAHEQTDLMLVPLTVSAYYRFDMLEKLWSIPLVPVAKAGVNYTLWKINGSDGNTATFQGDSGKGGTFGWHLSGALHLWLDWIEPETAAGFDRTWGINNTYLFAEFSHRQIDDFGSAESFNLSDDLWMFGIAFEY